MEIVIIVAIWSVIVKRGVEDILHVARGNAPRRRSAEVLEQSGAGRKYWNALRDDTFDGMLRRHNERVARRTAASPSKVERPRGAATQFFAGLFQDGRRAAGRSWAAGWTRLDERRRERSTRPRPGQDTVPGEVVPNVSDDEPPMYVKDGRGWGNCDTCGKRMVLLPYQSTCAWCTYERFGGASNPDAGRLTVDEAKRWTRGPASRQDEDGTEDGPQDEDRPDPRTDQDEDGRTDLRFGDDDTDPTGTKQCPECHGAVLVDGEACLSCRDRQEQRNQHRDEQEPPPCPKCGTTMTTAPNIGDPMSYDGKGIYRCPACDYKIRRSPESMDDITQEGPTTMTAAATEVFSLDTALAWCEQSTQQFNAQAQASDGDAAYCRKLAQAFREQATSTDNSAGSISGAGVSGPILASLAAAQEKANAAALDMENAAASFAAAQEKAGAAAADMEAAAAEFRAFKPGQEFYDSKPEAPDREFLTAGR